MEGIEEISFRIIASVGGARSMYINAIQEVKNGNYEQADQMMKEAEEYYIEGHKAHAELLTKQAQGEDVPFDLLLVHAEDQMMSAEIIKILADEVIALYKKIDG